MTKHGILLSQFVIRRGISTPSRIRVACSVCDGTVCWVHDGVLINDLVRAADGHTCHD
jgi:hypothetical protein